MRMNKLNWQFKGEKLNYRIFLLKICLGFAIIWGVSGCKSFQKFELGDTEELTSQFPLIKNEREIGSIVVIAKSFGNIEDAAGYEVENPTSIKKIVDLFNGAQPAERCKCGSLGEFIFLSRQGETLAKWGFRPSQSDKYYAFIHGAKHYKVRKKKFAQIIREAGLPTGMFFK